MTYRPQSLSKRANKVCFLCAAAAVLLFAASAFVARFEFAYQLTALILAVASVEIYMKYVGSDYVYEAAEASLKVYKITGKKSICVCSLDYEGSVTRVIPAEEYSANKSAYPKVNFCVNYEKNMFPKNYYVYMFEFNGKRSLMKFEPDEAFVNYVNPKIDSALNSKKEN